jgi:hypothetical protein
VLIPRFILRGGHPDGELQLYRWRDADCDVGCHIGPSPALQLLIPTDGVGYQSAVTAAAAVEGLVHGSRTCSVRSRQPRERLRQENQGSVASGGCSHSRALVKGTDNGSGCMLFWFHTGRTPRQQGMCICCPALSSQTYRGCQTCTDVRCVTAIHGRRLVPGGGHHCAWLVRCAVEMKSFDVVPREGAVSYRARSALIRIHHSRAG